MIFSSDEYLSLLLFQEKKKENEMKKESTTRAVEKNRIKSLLLSYPQPHPRDLQRSIFLSQIANSRRKAKDQGKNQCKL